MTRIEFDPHAVQTFIDDHLGEYKVKGDEYILVCPFCQGITKDGDVEISFNINVKTGAARCWRANKCRWRGTVVYLIKDYLGCDWRTAYNIAGGEMPTDVDEILAVFSRAKGLLRPADFAPVDKASLIDVFPKGVIPAYDSDQYDDICDWLQWRRNYDPDEFFDLHDLWVVTYEDSPYTGRVIFEVTTGRNRAFLAYAYDPSLQKKTLNPSGQVLSKMLYNYNDALFGDTIFVCEGIFDAARLMERGYYAVAIFGCVISIEQVFLLADTPASEIVVCLDNGAEEAARDVALEMGRHIDNKRISVMYLDVKDADPDSISEEDFVRCYLRRQPLLREEDRVNLLFKGLA